jgi:hypothetical protein
MKVTFTIPGEPDKEEWRDIAETGGAYQASCLGRVRSTELSWSAYNGSKICTFHKDGKVLNPFVTGHGYKSGGGYLTVSLGKLGNRKVHRLVAEAFLTNALNLPIVNHINGDKRDNRLDNLEWCSDSENIIHAARTGLAQTGEQKPSSKLTERDVNEIRRIYKSGSSEFGSKPLARRYGVSSTTVRKIVKREKWRYVHDG